MSNTISQPLLEPYTLGDLPLRNRIVMAPLTRTRAANFGHVPTDLMQEYYEQRATAGLIISEGTWVSEAGKGWYGAPGIYNSEQGAAWKAITDAVHAKGGRMFAQLWHQGAVSHRSFFRDGRPPLAPFAIDPQQLIHTASGTVMSETPREMTKADIKQSVADYRSAAQIAKYAGFDGVQIHYTHRVARWRPSGTPLSPTLFRESNPERRNRSRTWEPALAGRSW
jgi:N-ethylmaleimide reductase